LILKYQLNFYRFLLLEEMRLLPPVMGRTFDKCFDNALHALREEKNRLRKENKEELVVDADK
jgi:hypothetical protein